MKEEQLKEEKEQMDDSIGWNQDDTDMTDPLERNKYWNPYMANPDLLEGIPRQQAEAIM